MSNLSYHQPRMPLAPNRLLVRTLSGHDSYVTSVAFFGPLRDRIITGSYDDLAKLWDLKTGLCLRKFSGHSDGVTSVMPGPEGRVLTASEDRTIRAWDVDTGECSRIIRSHSGAVTGMCMAGPDRIVTGSTDKKLRVFDPSGNLCGEAEIDGEIMAVASQLLPAPAPSTSRAGRAIAGGDIVKDLFQSSEVGSASDATSSSPPSSPSSSSSSPASVRIFACGGTHIPSPAKPLLRRVDVKTGAATGAVAADAGTRPESQLCSALPDDDRTETGVVTCVAISVAGARGRGILISGSYDKGVRVARNVLSPDRDVDRGGAGRRSPEPKAGRTPSRSDKQAVVTELLGHHKDGVRAVAISADGRWAVSGGREGRVKVWEISQDPLPLPSAMLADEPAAVAEFEAHRGVVFSLCMSPDARVLVSAGSDKDVRVWDLSLVVYARRLVLNRSRELWSSGRIRRARPKRGSSSSGSSSPRTVSRRAAAGEVRALEAFGSSREQRQQILESLFALPEIIYAKVLMYV